MPKEWDATDTFLFDLVKKTATPVFLLLNKIDLLADKRDCFSLITQFQALRDFKEIIPIPLEEDGLDELLQCVLQALPKAPAQFPEDRSPINRCASWRRS